MKYILIGFGILLVEWILEAWLEIRQADKQGRTRTGTDYRLRREIYGKLLRRVK